MPPYRREKRRMIVGSIEEPRKETFLWKIDNFLMLSQNEDTLLESPRFLCVGHACYLEFYPNGETKHDSRGWLGLYARQSSRTRVSSTIDAGILNTVTGEIEFKKRASSTAINKFLMRLDLINRRYKYFPGDTLTIWIRFKHKVLRSKFLSKSNQVQERRLETLRAYNKYKEELSLLDGNKTSVWEKMAASVRRKLSLSKTEYGLQQFHTQMVSLQREYERKRNQTSSVISPGEATFLKEAQLAFKEDSVFSVKRRSLNSGDISGKDVQKGRCRHGVKRRRLNSGNNSGEGDPKESSEHGVKRTSLDSEDISGKDVQKGRCRQGDKRRRLNSENHSGEGDPKESFEHGVKRRRLNSGNHSGEGDPKESSEHGGLTLLSDHFRQLFFDKESSDVIIDVKGKTIKAHKMVLKVRSKKLFSMLKTSGTEDKNLVIKVEDCEPEAFKLFVLYLYTGKVEKLSTINMIHLYDIAVKFDAPELKAKCLKYIKRSVTVENVCSVTHVARKHKDSELLKCATDYFLQNVNSTMEIVVKK